MRSLTTILSAGLALLIGVAAASAQSVIIKTGPQGGLWYPISAGMAGVIQDKTDYQVTIQAGGGVSNAVTVARNEGQIGFTTPGDAVAVYNGTEERPAEPKLRTLGNLYNQYYTVSVPAGSPVKSMSDFKGRTLVTQRRGSSTEKITGDVLAAYGLSYDDLSKVNFAGSVNDAANQLRDNQVDGFSNLISHPAGYLLELSSSMPIRIIPLDQPIIEKIVTDYDGYSPITLEKGTYEWLTEDVPTVNSPVMLVTNEDVPEDVVYAVTKALLESHETLVDVHSVMTAFTPENAAANPPVPLHPGALRYYREAGVVD